MRRNFGRRWVDLDPHDPRFSREALAPRYRALFLKGLRKLYAKGRLVLPPSLSWIGSLEEFDGWLRPIEAKDWMVNVQPPPAGCDGPATALGYLGRYVAGTAIGDTRIVGDDGEMVTIRVKNYREGGEEETLEMPGEEFVGRFALHIVPPHFRRLRYAGILGQGKRTKMLARCRELLADRVLANAATVAELGSNDSETAEPDEVFEPEPSAPEPPKTCPRCRAREFVFIECYWPWENYDDLGVPPPDAETSSSGQVVLVASPEDRAQLVPP